jgi:hypothetical protein
MTLGNKIDLHEWNSHMDESEMLCVKLDLVNRIDMDGSNSKHGWTLKNQWNLCQISNLQSRKKLIVWKKLKMNYELVWTW